MVAVVAEAAVDLRVGAAPLPGLDVDQVERRPRKGPSRVLQKEDPATLARPTRLLVGDAVFGLADEKSSPRAIACEEPDGTFGGIEAAFLAIGGDGGGDEAAVGRASGRVPAVAWVVGDRARLPARRPCEVESFVGADVAVEAGRDHDPVASVAARSEEIVGAEELLFDLDWVAATCGDGPERQPVGSDRGRVVGVGLEEDPAAVGRPALAAWWSNAPKRRGRAPDAGALAGREIEDRERGFRPFGDNPPAGGVERRASVGAEGSREQWSRCLPGLRNQHSPATGACDQARRMRPPPDVEGRGPEGSAGCAVGGGDERVADADPAAIGAPLKRRVGILRLRLHGGDRVVFSGGEIDELQAVAAQVGDRPETAGL